ncbi:MAG: twin-arginine translocase TatA/TatE family subunit, partial [Alistipes sp.]|nr:twin-arginine translocase TatA/TatE family subunit [Alistipes sp.]
MMFIHPLFLGKIGLTEILVILLIVVIFFGGKKIPELMRGMGRGVRALKDAMENPAATDEQNGQEPPAPHAP